MGCIGGPEDVLEISCSGHNIRATKTGGIGCSFGPTETGSIRCLPDTLQIGATDTAADIAGSAGPGRAAPDQRLIHCLIPCVSAMELKSDIHCFSEVETNPEMSSLRSAYSVAGS
jgi:hypothetical protein